MSIVDEVRQILEQADADQQEQLRQKKLAQERQDRERHQQGITDANARFPDIIEDIKKSAAAGDKYEFVGIYSWNDSAAMSPWQDGYCQEMKRLLLAEGFETEDSYNSLEPVGSDPLFFHTTYSYSLKVTWKK